MYHNNKPVIHQAYTPPRSSSSSGSLSSGYSSDEANYHQQQAYYTSANMSSYQDPMRQYQDPRAAQQLFSKQGDGTAQAQYYYGGAQGGQGQQVYYDLQRTTQPVGQRHDVAGGPQQNPFGYYVVHRESANGPTSTHNYGGVKGPDNLERNTNKRR